MKDMQPILWKKNNRFKQSLFIVYLQRLDTIPLELFKIIICKVVMIKIVLPSIQRLMVSKYPSS